MDNNTNNFAINLLTKDLVHALNFSNGIVEKRPVKPILGNIKLDVRDSSLLITASSSDISMKVSVKGEVRSEGTCTVNIITFMEIVRKITDETISLNYDAKTEQLTVSASNFVSNFSTLPSEEFPVLANFIDSDFSFKMEAKKLLRLILSSEFSISTEETRYNLNGVYLNSNDDKILNATALDGHRLSSVSSECENSANFGVIIPRKTVFEMIKILKDSEYSDMEVILSFSSIKFSLSVGNTELISKLIDSTFPDYKSLIPTDYSKKLTIHAKFLAEAVDRVAAITHDKFRAIKLSLSQDKIEISGFGETKGSARELIENSNSSNFLYEGEDLVTGFNPKYLLDILKNLDDNEIEIHFDSSLSPIVIKPVIYDNDVYIIMPMNV